MLTPIASIARLARQTRAISVPLLVAGALAAGCGTTHAPGSGSATGSSSAAPSPASPSPQASPVPTVTGGAVAGQSACVGWPEKAPHRKMPALFDPIAVERCVTGIQQIPGKGEWQTATMEKATGDLGPLAAALLRPPVKRAPGTICPDLAMLPPQIVVINAAGDKLIPLLPLAGCGEVQAEVLSAIAALHWQPESVRLVAPVAQAPAGPASGSPKTFQTLPAAMAPGAGTSTAK